MKTTNLIILGLILLSGACSAQIKNAKTETIKISGNCGMCESTIEKAGTKKHLYKTNWDVDTKTAEISYDSAKTDLDHVLKQIALAGYDNDRFVAPDKAYNNLHGCCQYDREVRTATVNTVTSSNETALSKPDNHKQKDIELIKQEKEPIKEVLDNYFNVKDALVKSDGSLAAKNSAKLLKALQEVKMQSLKDNAHKVWMKFEKELKEDAKYIATTKSIENQRNHFASLSKNLYELVKVSKPEGIIYYEHCPMYNDNKGANWLSKESTIKNPYYGNKMLSCGSVIEKIK